MYSEILVGAERCAAARLFRVLGDPTRLHILELLEEKERSVVKTPAGQVADAESQS